MPQSVEKPTSSKVGFFLGSAALGGSTPGEFHIPGRQNLLAVEMLKQSIARRIGYAIIIAEPGCLMDGMVTDGKIL